MINSLCKHFERKHYAKVTNKFKKKFFKIFFRICAVIAIIQMEDSAWLGNVNILIRNYTPQEYAQLAIILNTQKLELKEI